MQEHLPIDAHEHPPYDSVARIDPQMLRRQAEACAAALLKEGAPPNTARAYTGALRYWEAWHRLRYRAGLTLPVPAPVVLQFLFDHVEHAGAEGVLVHDLPEEIDRTLVEVGFKATSGVPALNTVFLRLRALSSVHRVRGLPNPARDSVVEQLVRRVWRDHSARGVRPNRKAPLTRDPLLALLATCTDGLRGVRDRALLLFAFSSGGRRRSEVAAAVMDNLIKVDEQHYLYRLGHSKTDPASATHNPDADKPIVGLAAEALAIWLARAGIESGAIFRRLMGTRVAGPLSPQAVWLIVKRRAKLAGLQGDFGAHSLRSGFVTEAGRQNVSLGKTMALTGHHAVHWVILPFKAGSLMQTRALNLLEGLGEFSTVP
jgi:integrase